MRKQCVPGPLPAFWEGPGYEASDSHVIMTTPTLSHLQYYLLSLPPSISLQYVCGNDFVLLTD